MRVCVSVCVSVMCASAFYSCIPIMLYSQATKFDDTKRLHEDLTASYNSDIRPMWDDDELTKVDIGFVPIDIEDIQMPSGHMKARMWIRMVFASCLTYSIILVSVTKMYANLNY